MLERKDKSLQLHMLYHAVDNYDKNHLYMRALHRTLRWYWAVFLSLLKFTVLNAWALWKTEHPETTVFVKSCEAIVSS